MTKLLEEAFQKASKLPENLQDQLAKTLLEELLWEHKWDNSLQESSDALDTLAQKALQDFDSGKTEEKGFDEL